MKRDSSQLLDRLLREARGGSRPAFGQIYELWAEKIYRFCLKRSGREAAADLASEIFLKIWQGLPDFEGGSRSFPAWAYRIARHALSDHFRKKRLVPLPLDELTELPAEADPFTSADSFFDKKLEKAINSLSDDFRRAIELRYIQDLSFGQVARRMHKKEGTVRTTVSRALRALRDKLVK